jgi:NAD+ dependent glucose-6-phosphate dehydrogenase
MTKSVVIAGATGNIGTKLRRHFEGLGWTLRLIDLTNGGDPAVLQGDLSVWDESWVAALADADCVILLSGDPSPKASWSSVQRLNLDLTLNVFEAAARQRAKRLIFASSNWTMAGHRFAGGDLTTDRTPHPVNAYGMSKLVGERLGKSYSERWGLSVICFRIGYCQRGQNLPGPHMGWSGWGQSMWLSDRDLCNGFEKAVLAGPDVRFVVLNLMSDNPGMRWDIETTRRVIGYEPRDRHAAPEDTNDSGTLMVQRTRDLINAAETWLQTTTL